MKLRLLIFLTVIFYGNLSYAQSVQEVFTNKTMTWYGLDFSMAKFVGDFNGTTHANPQNASMIRDKFFPSWNAVIVNEKDKYKLPYFYNKDSVRYDLSQVEAINSTVNAEEIMFPENPPQLTDEQVQSAVNRYQANGKTGLGLVYIVEAFDKDKLKGIIHVTFFDIATGKILMRQKIVRKPQGFGLRNFWIKTAYETMNYSHVYWKKWKREAGVK